MNMSYSEDGVVFTEHEEGCRLTAYIDSGGVWTNGTGNTHGVVPGSTITQQQADEDLTRNIQTAVDAVNDAVTVELTQHQFDSLVDFTFNCGVHAFTTSTLLRKLNTGDYVGAVDEMDRWNKDNGKVVPGLVNRRNAEQELFDRA